MDKESEDDESQYSPSEQLESLARGAASKKASPGKARNGTSSPPDEHQGREGGTAVTHQSQQQSASFVASKPSWGQIDLQAYRELLNHAICRTVNKVDGYNAPPLAASHMGCSIWSAREKESLYYALDRKGVDDVQALSIAIKTKSPPEIRAYILFLQSELVKRNRSLEHHRLLEYSELPAAFEIGPRCETVLNQAADVLAERQFHYELKEEKDLFGAWFIIDRQAVFLSDDLTLDEDRIQNMPKQLQSAIKLLKVETLVDLSDQIFMNPNYIGKIREKHAKDHITPSITTMAVLDFQTLVISLTKRLVQSSLYFAMSRLRAVESASSGVKRRVRKQDVDAALDVLGMKSFDHDYWPGVARKYSLEVYDEVPSKKHARVRYTYSQAEQMLKSAHWDQLPSTEDEAADPESDPSRHESYGQVVVTDDDLAFFSDSSTNTNNASHTAFANALDIRASRNEETRLLGLLCDDRTPIVKEEEKEFPKAPKRKRKSKEDLVDWRDWVGYKSEWERYKTPLLEEDFLANRQKRRRTRSPSVQSSEEEIDQRIEDNDDVTEERVSARKTESSSRSDSQDERQDGSVIQKNPLQDQDTDSDSEQQSTSSAEIASPVLDRQRSPTSTDSGDDQSSSSNSSESGDTHYSARASGAAATASTASKPSRLTSHRSDSDHNAQITNSGASNSTSTSHAPSPLPSEPWADNDIEHAAQARSQPGADINAFLHGQILLRSSSSPAQRSVHNASDGSSEETGGRNTGALRRRLRTELREDAESQSGSDVSGSDGGSQELSFGERLAAMRSSAQDLPLRRFLGR